VNDGPAGGPHEIVATGVPNLDAVLGGGFRRGAVAMIVGPPGAGKTILAEQIGFAFARREEPVLFLTAYSETHEKLLAHSRGLSFFDADLLPDRIQFASLTDLLARGPEETEAAIVATARAHRARLVVLDGFGGMRRLLPDEHAAAGFVYSLGAKLAYLGATTLIVLEADPDESSRFGELTVSDVVASLRRERIGTRHRRVLEVLKARGGAPLGGLHPFALDADGVHVHPRIESLPPPTDPPWTAERLSFGVAKVDALTGGGPHVGTTTLAVGHIGTGKTLLGLHFMAAGAAAGEPGLYLGFRETPAQIREQACVFGLDLAGPEAAGLLRLQVRGAYEIEPDRIAEELLADVDARGVRRLVVDGANELRRALVPAERQFEFFAALAAQLRARGVTSYLALDTPRLLGDFELADSAIGALAENLLLLRQTEYRGALFRLISVLKMHFSEHEHAIHEFAIEAGRGLAMVGPAPAAMGLLGGQAQPLAPEDPPGRKTRPRRRA
jgi:circadian clock protein KaiC